MFLKLKWIVSLAANNGTGGDMGAFDKTETAAIMDAVAGLSECTKKVKIT